MNLEEMQKYSDLQTKLLTMLEIITYLTKKRIEIEEQMEQLKDSVSN